MKCQTPSVVNLPLQPVNYLTLLLLITCYVDIYMLGAMIHIDLTSLKYAGTDST